MTAREKRSLLLLNFIVLLYLAVAAFTLAKDVWQDRKAPIPVYTHVSRLQSAPTTVIEVRPTATIVFTKIARRPKRLSREHVTVHMLAFTTPEDAQVTELLWQIWDDVRAKAQAHADDPLLLPYFKMLDEDITIAGAFSVEDRGFQAAFVKLSRDYRTMNDLLKYGERIV